MISHNDTTKSILDSLKAVHAKTQRRKARKDAKEDRKRLNGFLI
jgi:hypothetical protein